MGACAIKGSAATSKAARPTDRTESFFIFFFILIVFGVRTKSLMTVAGGPVLASSGTGMIGISCSYSEAFRSYFPLLLRTARLSDEAAADGTLDGNNHIMHCRRVDTWEK